ncbi:MAG: GNAT family N-acetyltransferase [Tepidisphaeraceae bacterium]|jgi:GNAT superfamily N-acetyltransferase
MAALSAITVRELVREADIASACELMRLLRPHLRPETFTATVALQREQGYRLYAGYNPGLVCLAGVREARTLARGEHLFVDDLVTADGLRGQGAGTAMLRWLAQLAAGKHLPRIYLDSRDSAIGFYRKCGFTFLTSVPCWIEVEGLLGRY